jgi:two-component system response regulator MprA
MPPTILVVDDDPHIRDLLRRVLTRAGYDVEQAEDGMAALDQIATHAPDLILTDVLMPRLDGIGLARRLTGRAATIPVILMSGERVPSEDLVPFILKPFALQTVLELIRLLLLES